MTRYVFTIYRPDGMEIAVGPFDSIEAAEAAQLATRTEYRKRGGGATHLFHLREPATPAELETDFIRGS